LELQLWWLHWEESTEIDFGNGFWKVFAGFVGGNPKFIKLNEIHAEHEDAPDKETIR